MLAAAPAFADDAPPKLDSGDTAWMLASTALVLLMTIPGLALFYAGMVRKKNILATMMQSFTICCIVTIVWMVAGYSIAFTTGNALTWATSPASCCTASPITSSKATTVRPSCWRRASRTSPTWRRRSPKPST